MIQTTIVLLVIGFGFHIFGAAGASLRTEYVEEQAIIGLSATLFVLVIGIGVYATKQAT